MKIKISVNGEDVEVTLEEARKLHSELAVLFAPKRRGNSSAEWTKLEKAFHRLVFRI